MTAAIKRMRLRYAGTCSRCGALLGAGVVADYSPSSKTVACIECQPGHAGVEVSAEQTKEGEQPAQTATCSGGSAESTQPVLDAVDGTAGGSAALEFARRHEARQTRVQAAHPRIGRLLLAAFDDPQSTQAWAGGARGEQRLGELLAPIAGPQIRVLHDRRIPKSTANIDHLVVCPSGVFVVDAKRYKGQRPELRVEGGIVRPRQELLFIGGRNRTNLVEGMHKQVELVRSALADLPETVPTSGTLCFVEADWPLLGGSFVVQGVKVLWPKKLTALLTAPGPLDADEIAALQWRLHQAFPRK